MTCSFLRYHPLPQGYAERKVLMLVAAVKAVRQLHLAAAKQQRARTAATYRQVMMAGKAEQLLCRAAPRLSGIPDL